MSKPHPLDNTRLRWNIDFQSVRPAGLQPAESKIADNMFAGHTGNMPMFRSPAGLKSAERKTANKMSARRTGHSPMFRLDA
jgi:hypothetical protein